MFYWSFCKRNKIMFMIYKRKKSYFKGNRKQMRLKNKVLPIFETQILIFKY